MGKRVAGICFVKADGTQFEVKGGIEAPLNNKSREAVLGLAGVAGYKEIIQRPFVKLEAIFTPDFPISTLANSTNMTITVEFANGKVYTLSNAWIEGETVTNGEEGTATIEFSGVTGTWQ